MLTRLEIIHAEAAKCTTCGLCLPACPTFQSSGAEGDSPRGRIRLIDALVNQGELDPAATAHLSGCIECGACHQPCPTGVRVAVMRRAHRAETEAVDRPTFERRLSEVTELVTRDPGARLTLRAIRALLAGSAPDSPYHGSPDGGVLLLAGPMLEIAAPHAVVHLERALETRSGAVVRDAALTAALNRASGLLCDAGLTAEHDRALTDVADIVAARGYRQLSVVVADPLSRRLADSPLPRALRVVFASDVLSLAPVRQTATDLVVGCPSDHGAGRSDDAGPVPYHLRAANAPLLFNQSALDTTWRLVRDKRDWLAGRSLITCDVRDLVRFPGARHPAEPTTFGA